MLNLGVKMGMIGHIYAPPTGSPWGLAGSQTQCVELIEEKIFLDCLELNHDSLVVQPIAVSLYIQDPDPFSVGLTGGGGSNARVFSLVLTVSTSECLNNNLKKAVTSSFCMNFQLAKN
jgi:hypothetical protein